MGSVKELSLETWILLAVLMFAILAGCGPAPVEEALPNPIVGTWLGTMETQLESGVPSPSQAVLRIDEGLELHGVCPDGTGSVQLKGHMWHGVHECAPAAWGNCPDATMRHYSGRAHVNDAGELEVTFCGEGEGCGDSRIGTLTFKGVVPAVQP